jgi:hypothetical protein
MKKENIEENKNVSMEKWHAKWNLITDYDYDNDDDEDDIRVSWTTNNSPSTVQTFCYLF